MNSGQQPEFNELRPIVPLVICQGQDRWTYLTSFAELFAEARIIENLLQEGMAWSAIERIAGVNETQFQALKQRLEEMQDPG